MLQTNIHSMNHQASSPWESGTVEGTGGPEMTHGLKSLRSSKEEKYNPNKIMLKMAAVLPFTKEEPNGRDLFLGLRVRPGDGAFWEATWSKEMNRVVLKGELGLR